jgi:aarF domain-containing kinase
VAVKVQRPNAHQSIAVDIFILRLVLSLVKKATGMTRDLRLIADEVGAGLFSELDYRGEAQNALTFAQAHNKLDYVIVPKPLLGLTTRRVLTMEWIEGSSPAALFEELDREEKERRKPVSASARREEIEEGEGSRAKLKQMVNMGVACSLNQLLSTGVMHADPHPGNLLFTAEGKLAYVDFGLLTRVTPQHRYGMLSSILHMSSGDWEGFVGDMDTMELLKPTVSKRELATDLHERMGESSLNNFKKLLKVMAALGLKYKFTLPPYYVLVVRSLATLEGIALQVDSDFKIVSAAVPQALYIILNSTERNGSSFGSDLLEDFLLKPSGLLQEERISKVLDVLKDKNQPTNRGLLLLGGKEPKRGGLRWKTYLGKWCDVFKSASSALRGRPLALLHFWYISIRTVSLLLVQKFIHKMMIFFVKSERE